MANRGGDVVEVVEECDEADEEDDDGRPQLLAQTHPLGSLARSSTSLPVLGPSPRVGLSVHSSSSTRDLDSRWIRSRSVL